MCLSESLGGKSYLRAPLVVLGASLIELGGLLTESGALLAEVFAITVEATLRKAPNNHLPAPILPLNCV